jgi:predicted thioesterase
MNLTFMHILGLLLENSKGTVGSATAARNARPCSVGTLRITPFAIDQELRKNAEGGII